MATNEVLQLLKKAGFSEKEAGVYLALLSQGAAGATDIALRAGINRSTTYVILETLIKRGLVADISKGGVSMFDAGKPTQLVEYFKRAAAHFKGLASETEALLPAFEKQAKVKPVDDASQIYGAALSSLGGIHAAAKSSTTEKILKKQASKAKFAGEAA
jgi:sugar-specific transcriptional regulator TrmB